jgi:phenylacetaldehyde dehydrogenase
MAIEQPRAATTRADELLEAIDVPRELLIGGRWTPSTSGERLPVIDPSTGRQVTDVAAAGEADVDAAVAAGRAAFEGGS